MTKGEGIRSTLLPRSSVLLRRLKTLSWLSLLSTVVLGLGFVREIIVAREYGLSADLDTFIAVSGVYLFLGLQMGNALETTVISHWNDLPDRNTSNDFLFTVITCLIFLTIALTGGVLGVFDYGFALLFPNLASTHADSALLIMKIFLAAIVCASISGFLRGVLNKQRVFAPGVVGGAVISVFSIGAVLLFASEYGILALPFGMTIGNIVLMIWYIYLLRKNGLIRVPENWHPNWGLIRAFGAAVVIVLIGEFFYQLYGVSLRSIASRFGAGTISSFYYATSLMLLPLTLIISPLLTVVYPRMTEAFRQDKAVGTRVFIKVSIALVLFSLLAAVCLVLFANELVNIVFVRGEFSVQSGEKTAHILAVIAISLPFLSVNKLGRYALYSISDYKTSVYANFLSLIALLVFSWMLIPSTGIDGLAIAAVLATVVSMAWTILVLRTRILR
ncbi:MAG: hypothetical protein GC138_08510 [Gammaproteobacteria bacterium]|nr:hypothetical protein [Gammaproteobacteria bacterium]